MEAANIHGFESNMGVVKTNPRPLLRMAPVCCNDLRYYLPILPR